MARYIQTQLPNVLAGIKLYKNTVIAIQTMKLKQVLTVILGNKSQYYYYVQPRHNKFKTVLAMGCDWKIPLPLQ